MNNSDASNDKAIEEAIREVFSGVPVPTHPFAYREFLTPTYKEVGRLFDLSKRDVKAIVKGATLEERRAAKTEKLYAAHWASPKHSWHFQKRLFERYKIILEISSYVELQSQIISGQATKLNSYEDNNSAHYALEINRGGKTKTIFVAYDHTKNHFITAMSSRTYKNIGGYWYHKLTIRRDDFETLVQQANIAAPKL